nr:glutathione S-transferase C-terminal domain-containing protein [Usitatibacter palustris]
MKLIASHTSPYARKVRVVLAEKQIACDLVEENVWSPASTVPRHNPLNKIPTLILDDGTSLFDSSVITEYLDTLGGPPLIPGAGLERAHVRCDESLADGICDAALTIVLERKREAMRQDPTWMDRQRGKIDAGIEGLAKQLGDRPWLNGKTMTLADLAAGCALFYVAFRLPEIDWRSKHPNLAGYAAKLDARPSFAGTRPPA